MAAQQHPPTPVSILRRKDVEARTGLSRSTIYGKLAAGSDQYDPSFPAPIKLGPKSVGWIAGELDAWLAGQIEKSRTAAPMKAPAARAKA